MNLTDLSVIRSLLGQEQTAFKKKFGQNFLTSPAIVEKIADAPACAPARPLALAGAGDGTDCADPQKTDFAPADPETMGILEIGPGIGVLTDALARRYRRVVAVEIDPDMVAILGRTLEGLDNVTVIGADVLKVDLAGLIAENFADCESVAVCANLPYYITTPILMKLLESGVPFSSVTVMVQKEVAARITASAGSADYGALTAAIAYYGRARRLFPVSAGHFVPAPKVDSAVVQIVLSPAPTVDVPDPDLFFAILKAAFGQRRKTLVNALSAAFPALPKERIAECVAAAGFPPTLRGEALDVRGFAALCIQLHPLLNNQKIL